jgi:hypothetical protein
MDLLRKGRLVSATEQRSIDRATTISAQPCDLRETDGSCEDFRAGPLRNISRLTGVGPDDAFDFAPDPGDGPGNGRLKAAGGSPTEQVAIHIESR